MSIHISRARAGIGLMAAICCASFATAQAKGFQYRYLGPKFYQISGNVLTTSDRVEFRMTLPSKLAANLNAVLVTPTSWTMNNGVVRFGNKIPNTSLGMVQISTDANGKIDAWSIGGQSSIPGDLYNEFFTVTQSNGADYGLEVLPAGLYAEGANTPGNGTWTQP